MNQTVQNRENYEADLAAERAIGAYIESRREKVPDFLRKHFSFKGAVRLNRLIDCLNRELRGLGDSRLKIRDQYVARVFDLADLFKKAARTFV